MSAHDDLRLAGSPRRGSVCSAPLTSAAEPSARSVRADLVARTGDAAALAPALGALQLGAEATALGANREAAPADQAEGSSAASEAGLGAAGAAGKQRQATREVGPIAAKAPRAASLPPPPEAPEEADADADAEDENDEPVEELALAVGAESPQVVTRPSPPATPPRESALIDRWVRLLRSAGLAQLRRWELELGEDPRRLPEILRQLTADPALLRHAADPLYQQALLRELARLAW